MKKYPNATFNNSEVRALADELTRLRAQLIEKDATIAGWVKANCPDGWIGMLRAEVEALRKGEFVCQKCAIRKNDEYPITHEF